MAETSLPTVVSVGYGGTIDEVAWANITPHLGADFGVMGAGDWRVTADPTGDRRVKIAPGVAFGRGVFDTLDLETTFQFPAIASGSRWDVLYVRRSWSGGGGTTTLHREAATTAGDIPGTRQDNPGVVVDQPLALVRLVAGQTVPAEIVDLRVWQANGGAVAVSDKVLQYLNAPGTEVRIGATVWTRVVSAAGVESWERTDAESRYPRLFTAADSSARSWAAGTWGQMATVTVPSARAGEYLLVARATVRQTSGILRALVKRFAVGGVRHGDEVQDDMTSGQWLDRGLEMPLTWSGGSLTVSYQASVAADASVRQARVTLAYLGPRGW